MNFVRGVLVTLLFAGLAVFAFTNDQRVTVNLWGMRQLDLALALVVAGSFLIGFVPIWLKAMAERGLLKRKLTRLEGEVGQLQTQLGQARTELLRPPGATQAEPAPPAAEPVSPMQPQAIPQAPPPGI